MQVSCKPCGKYTEHKSVDSSLDIANGWKTDIKTQGGCRDNAANYITVQCTICKSINTYDFATD